MRSSRTCARSSSRLYKQVENVAASTLRLRPVFLGRQPFDKRCSMIQKAMALKMNAETAAEVLAAYYMERHPESVVELLDALGVEHEEGALRDPSPGAPKDAKLKEIVETFRKEKDVLKGARAAEGVRGADRHRLALAGRARAGRRAGLELRKREERT